MAEIMTKVQQLIESIIMSLGYVGIALVMLAENLFPPIPSELVMPFAGFIAGRGEMSVPLVLLAGTIGAVAGALALYYIGRWADETIIRRFVRNYGKWFLISEADLDRTLGFFERHGEIIVFTGRLIPLVRSLISIPAGMNRMPMGRFLLWTTAGSLLWNGVLTYAGVILESQWERVLGFVDQYEKVALGLIALALIAFIASRLLKKRRGAPAISQPKSRKVD